MGCVVTPETRKDLMAAVIRLNEATRDVREAVDQSLTDGDAKLREMDELRAILASVDCRFVDGRMAHLSGSHCPVDVGCARCDGEGRIRDQRTLIADLRARLAAAEREKHAWAASVLREIDDRFAMQWQSIYKLIAREEAAAKAKEQP